MDLQSVNSKTNVLYIVESFSTGVYAILRDIAVSLDPQQFHIHIIHSLRSDSPKDFQEDLNYDHISLEYVPMDSAGNYLRAVKQIRRTIRKFQPDAVHLHSSKAGFLGRIAAKREGHTHVFYSPHGLSFLRLDVGRIKRSIFFLLERFISWYAGGTVIAVSQGELKEAKRITDNAVLINNFIEIPEEISNKESETPLVATSGRISPQKNPDLFTSIARTMPEVQFLWIGDGPQRDRLTAENISVTGYLSRSQVLSLLKGSWVYLQTSKWEGMPVSVLEAMALGKPVTASRIIGNCDLIEHGKTGFLYTLDDIHGFKDKIRELLQNRQLRESIGKAARAHAEQHHDVKKAVEAYADMYRSIEQPQGL